VSSDPSGRFQIRDPISRQPLGPAFIVGCSGDAEITAQTLSNALQRDVELVCVSSSGYVAGGTFASYSPKTFVHGTGNPSAGVSKTVTY